MQKILAGLEGVECQIDNILVFGDTCEQHAHRMEAVSKSIDSVIDKTGNPGQDSRSASRNCYMQSPNQGIGLVARFGQTTG